MSKKRDEAKRRLTKISFILLAAAVLLSASVVTASFIQAHNMGSFLAQDPDDNIPPYPDDVPATPAKTTSSPGCDQSLWQHVHQPSRLHILDNCVQVSGTIAGVRAMGDGDYHIYLRPDLKDLGRINIKNVLFTGGTLIAEAVCTRPPIDEDAVSACKGLIHHVNVPPAGTHVVITGSYVNDMPHGWNEIHPVTSITTR